jgi:cobalt/nickel transport system permease protein
MPEHADPRPVQSFGTCDCGVEPSRTAQRPGGHIARILGFALQAEDFATAPGLLQKRDPRFKIGAMLALILAATWSHNLATVWFLVLLVPLLARLSRIPLRRMMLQAGLPVLAFTGLIAAPAIFLVPGQPIFTLPLLGWSLTDTGLRSALMLIGRAEAAAGFALLLVLTTQWPQLVKALSTLGVPAVIVAILAMTQRYIFIFLQGAMDMQEAHHSRIIAPVSGRRRRQMIGSAAGVLFTRSLDMGQNVHDAMIARGYRGQSLSLSTWHAGPGDYLLLGTAVATLAAVIGLHL